MRLPPLLLVVCLSWSAAAQPTPATRPATGPAPSVVFVLDATGSMSNRMSSAAQEIVRGVAGLSEGTKFNVVSFRDGGKTLTFSKAMAVAKPGIADAVAKHVADITPGGFDGSLAAVLAEVAKLKPQTVWFCTDGTFNEPAKSVDTLAAAAKRGGFRLNVVFFGDAIETTITTRNSLATAIAASGGKALNEDGKPFEPIVIAAKPAPAPKPVKPANDRPSIFQE